MMKLYITLNISGVQTTKKQRILYMLDLHHDTNEKFWVNSAILASTIIVYRFIGLILLMAISNPLPVRFQKQTKKELKLEHLDIDIN